MPSCVFQNYEIRKLIFEAYLWIEWSSECACHLMLVELDCNKKQRTNCFTEWILTTWFNCCTSWLNTDWSLHPFSGLIFSPCELSSPPSFWHSAVVSSCRMTEVTPSSMTKLTLNKNGKVSIAKRKVFRKFRRTSENSKSFPLYTKLQRQEYFLIFCLLMYTYNFQNI